MEQKVVLVTGAGRGIGKGLTKYYLSQPNTTVIAGLRNTTNADATALNQLPVADGSILILARIDSTSPLDAKTAISNLKSEHEISHIDIAIANAGICDHLLPLAEMDIAELSRHIDTNTYGVLRLFQATWPLLEKARAPKFVCISSSLGSISQCGGEAPYTGAYGISKAAANFLVSKIDAEYENLNAFSIDPGFVQTDMGNRGARLAGLSQAHITVQESVEGITREIEKATKDRSRGVFRSYNGEHIPW